MKIAIEMVTKHHLSNLADVMINYKFNQKQS